MDVIGEFLIENSMAKEVRTINEINKDSKVVYEVLRIIDRKPLFLENHLARMKNSFNLINIEYCLNDDEIVKDINTLIEKNNKIEGNIKITYNVSEKLLRIFFIKHSYPSELMYENGVKTILYFGERDNPNAKIINQSFRDKVNNKIKQNYAYEAILVDRNGYITEGSKSNIFMVKNNIILTSPVKSVLPGVTRGEIIKIANDNNIEVREIEYKYSDINKLQGMFICGTSPKILPINKVNDMDMNKDNKIIRKLMECYNNEIDDYIRLN